MARAVPSLSMQPHQPASGSNDSAPSAPRGASTAWADARDEGDVPQQPPGGHADAVSSSESEPGCEVLAPAVPPQDYDAGGRTPRLQEQYDRIGNIWRWPTDPYDDQWRASRELTLCRFPATSMVPGTLPPLHTWPYYANRKRLAKKPWIRGSLACQFRCTKCRARVCGRDERPGRYRLHRKHECDECHFKSGGRRHRRR